MCIVFDSVDVFKKILLNFIYNIFEMKQLNQFNGFKNIFKKN